MVLAEMTLRSLVPGPEVGHEDFLARADILGALGLNVLISRFEPFHELAEYLAGYTEGPARLAGTWPRTGSLRAGAAADLVVWNADLHALPAARLAAAAPAFTVVAGVLVHRAVDVVPAALGSAR